jgi:hypothetical protein
MARADVAICPPPMPAMGKIVRLFGIRKNDAARRWKKLAGGIFSRICEAQRKSW